MVIRVSQKVLISFREIQGVCSVLERNIGAFRVSRVFQGGYRVFQGGYRDLQGLTERFDHFHGVPSIYFETNLGLFLYFTLYYKMRQRLLQNAAALLDDHFVTKRGKGSYKTRQLWYYKTRQRLLQNAAGITKRGKGSYKTRQVLQNAAIITKRGSTSSHRAKSPKNGAILDLAKILHLDINMSAGCTAAFCNDCCVL